MAVRHSCPLRRAGPSLLPGACGVVLARWAVAMVLNSKIHMPYSEQEPPKSKYESTSKSNYKTNCKRDCNINYRSSYTNNFNGNAHNTTTTTSPPPPPRTSPTTAAHTAGGPAARPCTTPHDPRMCARARALPRPPSLPRSSARMCHTQGCQSRG